MLDLNALRGIIDEIDYQPRFVTVSGAHLYGFPSPDSDVDLRGCHQLPLEKIVGLGMPEETIDRTFDRDGIEIDLVSHDVGKYLSLLVKNNGYILEQVFSPLVICSGDFLDRLRPLAMRCITKHCYHHYRGFFANQRKLIEKEEPVRVKPVLYAYRVLMTGIYLLRTGRVEADIRRLNQDFGLAYIPDLIAQKTEEHAAADLDWEFHNAELQKLEAMLDKAFEESTLPEKADHTGVSEFLVQLRLDENS